MFRRRNRYHGIYIKRRSNFAAYFKTILFLAAFIAGVVFYAKFVEGVNTKSYNNYLEYMEGQEDEK